MKSEFFSTSTNFQNRDVLNKETKEIYKNTLDRPSEPEDSMSRDIMNITPYTL